MPMPFGPLVGFPQPEGPMLPPGGVQQGQPQMDPETAMSLMQTLIGSMTGQMNDAAGQPGAPMMDMPQQTNPLAAMAATFSASMADQLTGRQQHLAGVQQTLQQQESDRLAAQHYNIKTEAENLRQKQLTRLQFLEQVNDVQLKMAQEMGDLDKIEKRHKNALALAKQTQALRDQSMANKAEAQVNEKPPTTVSQDVTAQTALEQSRAGELFHSDASYENLGEKTGFGPDWLYKDTDYQRGPMKPEIIPEFIDEVKIKVIDSPSLAQAGQALSWWSRVVPRMADGRWDGDDPQVVDFVTHLAMRFGVQSGEWLATHGIVIKPQGQ